MEQLDLFARPGTRPGKRVMMVEKSSVAKPYQPSNGTEGDWFEGEWFEGEWCAQCVKWNDGCDIHCLTLFYDVDSPEYPKEWVKDNSSPRCTAFISKKKDI